jgi:hypothetical protein
LWLVACDEVEGSTDGDKRSVDAVAKAIDKQVLLWSP